MDDVDIDKRADGLLQFCDAHGWPPTPENLKRSFRLVEQMLACLAEKNLPTTRANLQKAYCIVTSYDPVGQRRTPSDNATHVLAGGVSQIKEDCR